ncbi:MAG: UvrD-helicase domain-containing protein [Granulosicoccus sp.]|nr:UvrD-helicase domain-containing protein [Granulosicoccus sp.]
MGLNPQQLAAVTHIDSPLLVLAGAGSGKTGVITQKIAWLIKHQHYSARSIVAVTFTNKAALEMRTRLKKQLPSDSAKGLLIATFHRLGINILHKDGQAIGLRRGFTILDQGDAHVALQELLREANSNIEARTAQQLISNWKNQFISPAQALDLIEDDQQRACALVYGAYTELLRACNSVDFDDLICHTVALLREHNEVREKWQNRIRHLLVDEYQDTNSAQYELVRLLVDKFGAFTAVGDDDQSIYAWRGARPQNLAQLKVDYPNLKVIKLEQNYRSSQRILRSANMLISKNPHTFEKRLWSDLGIGDPLRIAVCKHAVDEAQWVAADILTRHFQKGTPWKHFAILYRSNFQSRPFEQALREKQIPYAISGASSFFDKSEIKDMLAYLKLLVNPDDDTAFLRCVNTPRREIGPSTLSKLGQHAHARQCSLFAACHDFALEELINGKSLQRLQRFAHWINLTADNANRGDVLAVLEGMFDEIDYRSWIEKQHDNPAKAQRAIENTQELLAWIKRLLIDEDQNDRTLLEVVRLLSLHDMLARQDEQGSNDQVQLMTLHSAKGLEFPHVFIAGMEEELLPHRNSLLQDDIEEERRLAYVGMTRAQHTLTFTRSRSRLYFGETNTSEASRFLDELPENDVILLGELSESNRESAREAGKGAIRDLMTLLSDE